MTTYDRDALIRMAITPDETVGAPAELGDLIYGTILATPQLRRLPRFLQQRWLPSLSPSLVMIVLLALLLAGIAAVALSRPSSLPPPLTMYHGGPGRTGLMPGPGPVGQPVLDWQAERNGAIRFTVMPLVSDGRVLVADDGGSLAALDEETGTELWSVDVGSPIRASPVLVGDLVISGSDEGDVVALAVVDGAERWRTTVSGPVSASLAAVGNELYIGSESGTFHVLDAVSGDELWSIDGGGLINRGPAIADSIVYLGTATGRLVAISATTHRVIWSRDLSPGGIGTPAVAGGRVFLGNGLEGDAGQGRLVALDARSGGDAWTFKLGERLQIHVGAVDEERVYGVSTDLNVYAVDRETGALVWTFRTGSSNGALAGLVDGTLFVSSADGTVHALNAATGERRWSFTVDGDLTIPVVVNGRVIVGTSSGRVVAIAGSEPR